MKPVVTAFFDENTNTVTYVVKDSYSDVCVIIDPVLDFDPASGRTSTGSADQVLDFVRQANHILGVIDFGDEEGNAQVERLVDERNQARQAGDFGRADAIRDELRGLGVHLSDAHSGT